jgi:hypothetical protein
MSIGPVEYMIVAFPGNKFKGEIVPALKELVDAGTIRIIDLAFVMKDADGAVGTAELADLDSDVFKAFDALSPGDDGPAQPGRPGGRGRGTRPELVGGAPRVGRRLGDEAA